MDKTGKMSLSVYTYATVFLNERYSSKDVTLVSVRVLRLL